MFSSHLLLSAWWGHIPTQHAPRLLTEYHHFCCLHSSWVQPCRACTL